MKNINVELRMRDAQQLAGWAEQWLYKSGKPTKATSRAGKSHYATVTRIKCAAERALKEVK